MSPQILVVVGPTASGKSHLALALARHHQGEIVSADSMQIYQGMDVGTAKATWQERQEVPHHMLDVVQPWEDFSVARYVELATVCVDQILARGALPIVVGGTGLYVDSLLAGRAFAPLPSHTGLRVQLEKEMDRMGGEAMLRRLKEVDPETGARLHPNDHKRIIRSLEVYEATGHTISQHNRRSQTLPPRYQALRVGLRFAQREDMWSRIDRRVDEMVALGLVEEVRGLMQGGLSCQCTAMQAIGYKELAQAVRGEEGLETAVERVKLRSRQYAKRQLTWFGKDPQTHWILWKKTEDFEEAERYSTELLQESGLL